MTFSVFREENRKGGLTDWVGEIKADNEETALQEARDLFECPETCHLYVKKQEEKS